MTSLKTGLMDDRILLWNQTDKVQTYYNETRLHSSLEMTKPMVKAIDTEITQNVVSLDNYR